MAVLKSKPTSAGRRHHVRVVSKELHKGRLHEDLQRLGRGEGVGEQRAVRDGAEALAADGDCSRRAVMQQTGGEKKRGGEDIRGRRAHRGQWREVGGSSPTAFVFIDIILGFLRFSWISACGPPIDGFRRAANNGASLEIPS